MLILKGHFGVPDAFNPLKVSDSTTLVCFFDTLFGVFESTMLNQHLLKVSGADDDSNFDVVEDNPPVPDLASLKPNKEFRLVT